MADQLGEGTADMLAQEVVSLRRELRDLQLQLSISSQCEAQTRALFEEAPAPILVADRMGVVVDANRSARTLLGRTNERLLGYRVWDLVALQDRRKIRQLVREIPGTGHPVCSELSILTSDEPSVTVQVELTRLTDGRVYISTRDAHERRARETALEQRARDKDDFLAMLGHELRKPLGAIGAAVSLQQAVPMTEPRLLRAREVIARQTAYMSRIVEDIFDLSRIVRGRVQLHTDLLDVVSLVQSNVDDFCTIIAHKGLELELNAPPTPLWIIADATRISQILANLLDNATKFTVPPGLITVQVEIERDIDHAEHVVIAVRDTGIGMKPGSAKRIFELFRQGTRASERSEGLGVGLALVKSLVELHRGTVEAHSEGVGRGSEFIVRFPLAAALTHDSPCPVPSTTAQPG